MKRFIFVFTALCVAMGYCIISSNAANFSDVPETAWYADAVNTTEYFDIMNGYPDGTFRPEQKITRAEFAAILDRIDISKSNIQPNYFADSQNAWYSDVVQDYGDCVGGSSLLEFYPNAPVEREDVAVGIFRVIVPHLKDDETQDTFPPYADAEQFTKIDAFGNVYSYAAGTLYKLNIMRGNGNYFYPKQSLSRAEMAQIFLNLVRAGYGFV